MNSNYGSKRPCRRRGVEAELREGRLFQVLAEVTPGRPGFPLYFPEPRKEFVLPRAFIDHFRAA